MVGEIVALFDLNNDGKIDYLEFETFLNQKFPEVEKEASLYAGTGGRGGGGTFVICCHQRVNPCV